MIILKVEGILVYRQKQNKQDVFVKYEYVPGLRSIFSLKQVAGQGQVTGQIFMYEWEALVTRNLHDTYEGSI